MAQPALASSWGNRVTLTRKFLKATRPAFSVQRRPAQKMNMESINNFD